MGLIAGSKGWVITLLGEVPAEVEAALPNDEALKQWVLSQISVALPVSSTLRVAWGEIKSVEQVQVQMNKLTGQLKLEQ